MTHILKKTYLAASGLSLMLASQTTILADGHFPVTVENCGVQVTIAKQPKRVFLVNNDSISLVDEVNSLDTIIARTATPVKGAYTDQVMEMMADVPLVSKKKNDTGGSIITLESVLSYQPDLVLSPDSSVDRDALAQSGIPLYSPPAFCKDKSKRPSGDASYQLVYSELKNYGKMFGQRDLASQKIAKLKAIASNPGGLGKFGGTGAAFYVGGNGTLYPYGAGSMVTPIFNAVGIKNVYEGEKQRVFEVSMEDILGKNPDTVVLLLASGTAEDLVNKFYSISGTESLNAVKNEKVVVLPFAFTDPPTPHSVYGAKELAKRLSELR